jgi:hypothetical protein
MDLTEMLLWILSLAISFVLGWLTNWYFYRKQVKEGEANTAILRGLQQKADAEVRLGNDKRGKIIKNPDGTYAVAWKVEIKETLGLSESSGAQKKENG